MPEKADISAGVWPGGHAGPVVASVVAGLATVPGWAAITCAHWSSEILWERVRGGGLAASPSHATPPGVGSTMDVCGGTKGMHLRHTTYTRHLLWWEGDRLLPDRHMTHKIQKKIQSAKQIHPRTIFSCY